MKQTTRFEVNGDTWIDRDYEATRGNLTLCFDWDDMEGLNGDYDADDPTDVPVLRMSLLMSNGRGVPRYVFDSSQCTMLDARVDTSVVFYVMGRMLDIFERMEKENRMNDVKWICQRFSWVYQWPGALPTNVETLCKEIETEWAAREFADLAHDRHKLT
jgi:hypothetical protein